VTALSSKVCSFAITASSAIFSNWLNGIAPKVPMSLCFMTSRLALMADAEDVLNKGADKISINSPALADPGLISELAQRFGSQCVVIGVDSREEDGDWFVYQYTGDPDKMTAAQRRTLNWVREVQDRGAGEIVLNCMNQDGVRKGYDCAQLAAVRAACTLPLIASGGAGAMEHFRRVFEYAHVDGALAASVFHSAEIPIPDLKRYLADSNIDIRV
jgi:cyclase